MIRSKHLLMCVLALVMTVALALPAFAAETKGKVKSVDYANNKLVFTDVNGKDWTFTFNKDAKVLLNDKEMKLSDIKENDDATIIYEKKDDNLNASEIRATRK
jgi:hypothetical protein